MSRQRRLKHESAESGSYSSSDNGNSSNSNSSGGGRESRHLGNATSDTEHSDKEQSRQMDAYEARKQDGFSSDTEEYFSAGNFERNQSGDHQGPEQMDVDVVTKRKRTKNRTRQKVKRLLHAMSNLLN